MVVCFIRHYLWSSSVAHILLSQLGFITTSQSPWISPPPCFSISFSSLSRHHTLSPLCYSCSIPAQYYIILLTSLVKVSENCGDEEMGGESECVCDLCVHVCDEMSSR